MTQLRQVVRQSRGYLLLSCFHTKVKPARRSFRIGQRTRCPSCEAVPVKRSTICRMPASAGN